jgi:hypothetical protein
VNTARSVIRTFAAAGRSFLSVRRWFAPLVAALALSVGFAAIALAAGGPPIGPAYDCYTFPVYAQMTYFESLQLKSATTYLLAPDRKGTSLSGPVQKGTYKLVGSKFTFLTGTFARTHWYGLWKLKTLKNGGDQRHIGLYTTKGQNVMECYPPPY